MIEYGSRPIRDSPHPTGWDPPQPTPSCRACPPAQVVPGGAWGGEWGESLMGIFPYQISDIGYVLLVYTHQYVYMHGVGWSGVNLLWVCPHIRYKVLDIYLYKCIYIYTYVFCYIYIYIFYCLVRSFVQNISDRIFTTLYLWYFM